MIESMSFQRHFELYDTPKLTHGQISRKRSTPSLTNWPVKKVTS